MEIVYRRNNYQSTYLIYVILGTDFQEWLVELFTKLHNLTENNFIPKSHYLEYGFQKMGKNFSYPVSEKFTTSDNDESLLSE